MIVMIEVMMIIYSDSTSRVMIMTVYIDDIDCKHDLNEGDNSNQDVHGNNNNNDDSTGNDDPDINDMKRNQP